MFKFFLIVLLFCSPIIATAEQLPISLWPNPNCEIIKVKTFPMKCNNEKYLSWLVRMNQDMHISGSVKDNFHDLQCRDECFKSSDCLTIRQDEDTCFRSHRDDIDDDEYYYNDVLQLACCDKKPPEVVPEKFIPFESNNKTYSCIPSKQRNNCSHFYVWFQTKQIPFIGRDIGNQSVQDIMQCFELCRSNSFCTAIFFHSDQKICKMKYSSEGFVGKKNNSFLLASPKDWAVELHCCKYEITDGKSPDEEKIVACQTISTWFIVVLFISYFILMAVYSVWFFLQIKFKEINEIKPIDELNEVYSENKKRMKILSYLRRSFSDSSLFNKDSKLPKGNKDRQKPGMVTVRVHSSLSDN